MSKLISGGYSVGVPPLPIPNREVKPVRADGTAYSGRVGRRHFSERFFRILKNLFFSLLLWWCLRVVDSEERQFGGVVIVIVEFYG